MENNGWIKLWEGTIYNHVWRDDYTAWKIFEYLLITSYRGKPQGTAVKTLQQITDVCGGKNGTNFKAINRLKKYGMVETKSTNRNTTYKIVEWWKYQGKGSAGKNEIETKSKPSKTLIRIKNKEYIDTKVSTSNSKELDGAHEWICNLFGKDSNRFKFTPKRKQQLQSRLKELGKERFKQAYEAIAASDWHRGENDRGWRVDDDPYWLIANAERAETWANKFEVVLAESTPVDLTKVEVRL